MTEGDELKGLVVVGIAAVLLLLMLLPVFTATEPRMLPVDVVNHVNLELTGDVQANWDFVGPAEYVCGPETHYCRLTNTTEPDGYSSFIDTNQSSVYDEYNLTDYPFSAETTIITVQIYFWAKGNVSSSGVVQGALIDNVTDCSEAENAIVTTSWMNYTYTYTQSCDDDAWNVTDLSNARLSLVGDASLNKHLVVTYAGALVTYSVLTYVPEDTPAVSLTLLIPFILLLVVLLAIIMWTLHEE